VRIDRPGDPIQGAVVELERLDGQWRLRFDGTRLARHDADVLVGAIRSVVDAMDDDVAVGDVDLLGPELRTQVVRGWNETFVPYDTEATIHSLVTRQANLAPDVNALVCEGDSITYAELEMRTNQLAHHLLSLGVGSEDLVGVHVERSIGLVVAALAAMKAGAAYVPLDPAYPHDRLVHMIKDSGCRVIITESALAGGVSMSSDVDLTHVHLDTDQALISTHPTTDPAVGAASAQIAYCIYTSGSTGLPKGVLVEHRNAVNFFLGMDDRVDHELPATWFAVTSLSFDISVLELLYTLTRGFTVVVHLDRERIGDGNSLGCKCFQLGCRLDDHPQLRTARPEGGDVVGDDDEIGSLHLGERLLEIDRRQNAVQPAG
jgi:non-ribosomal peptide synthetase component F